MSNVASDDAKGEDGQAPEWLCLVDSINYVTAAQAGLVVLSGSHGGLYSAAKGLGVRPRGLVLNDAGIGLDEAGIAALAEGERAGVAVATVDHRSARIGDAADMRRRGILSRVNAVGRAAGLEPGMSCAAGLALMSRLAPSDSPVEARREHRHEVSLVAGAPAVACIDSASLIRPEDAGRIVVTGSHGGLIGGDAAKAINVACRFAAFNDAGGGCEGAGLGRLAPLDRRNIAAVTVSHDSAAIGDGVSTLEQGVISHANRAALRLGAEPGFALREALTRWLAASFVGRAGNA